MTRHTMKTITVRRKDLIDVLNYLYKVEGIAQSEGYLETGYNSRVQNAHFRILDELNKEEPKMAKPKKKEEPKEELTVEA